MSGKNALGMLSGMYFPPATNRGNINLWNRPSVWNSVPYVPGAGDGYSTVRSITIDGPDGNAYLVPTVSDDGRIMDDNEAVLNFLVTGRHLGKFAPRDYKRADKYAVDLHNQQAGWYRK